MKNPFLKNKISIQEKITGKVTSIANKLVSRKIKNKNLDQRAVIISNTIPHVGVPMVRNMVINAINDEVNDCIKKGMTDNEILQPCKDSPNYLKLLDEVGLNVENIKIIIQEKRTITKEQLIKNKTLKS